MMYVRYPPSLRNVEDFLVERGSTSAMRPSGFGGTGLARCSPPRSVSDALRTCAAIPQWRWHLDEVDHEGEVLEAVVTAKRDKAAALRLLKRIMKKVRPTEEHRHRRASCVFRGDERNWLLIGTRLVAGSTIGRRILINRFADESARCGGFEV